MDTAGEIMVSREMSIGRWLLSISALVILAATAANAADYEIYEMIDGANILGGQAQSLAYSLSPPRSIAIELDGPWTAVDLKGDGRLQLAGSIPVAGSQPLSRVVVNICTVWNLWHPYGGTIYQVRPDPITSNIQWTNYVLNIDVPSLSWGATTASASIIKASDYMRSQPTRIAIVPTPTAELGPGAAQDTEPRPYMAMIRFPKVSLEWFRATDQARVRAGNLVLVNGYGIWWDDLDPNVFHLGQFKIDLDQRLVYYVERDGTDVLTSLGVTVDDSAGGDVVYLEPDLWW